MAEQDTTSLMCSHLEKVCEEHGFLSTLARKMTDILSDPQESAAHDMAAAVDQSYHADFLTYDPLAKFQEDKGIAQFLNELYGLLLDVVCLISYDDNRQDILAHTLVELRKLQPIPCKIWNEDCLVYKSEPCFNVTIEDSWNACYVGDDDLGAANDTAEQIQQRCDQWVNFSSFNARCIQAGLFDNDDDGNRCRHPSIDIPKGLERNYTSSPIRDCKVLVAAQYLILAGSTLHTDYEINTTGASGEMTWGAQHWQLWKKKLEELSARDDVPDAINGKVSEALDKMNTADAEPRE